MTTPPALPPQSRKGPSAMEAAQDAAAHVRRILFPFQFQTWLALGFLAFLDQCGRSGGGVNPFPGGGSNWGNGGGGSPRFPDVGPATAWIGAHILLLVGIVIVALAAVVATMALLLWLNCRGIFMYLDAVVTGRPDIGRSWTEHAERASSLFAWRFAIGVGSLGGFFVLALVVGAIVLGAARMHAAVSTVGAVAVVIALGLFLVVLIVALSLASLALRDFVAPIQMASNVSCGDAVGVLVGLVKANVGAFVVYVLLKIVFQFVFGMAAAILCCVTCCLATLPVIAQTLLQPALFFERAWSLHFLQQMGIQMPGGLAPPPPKGPLVPSPATPLPAAPG